MRAFWYSLLCGCCVGLLSSCSPVPDASEDGSAKALVPVSCIAVLPSLTGDEEAISEVQGSEQNARRGALYADSVLRQRFIAESRVKMVPERLFDSLGDAIDRASEETGCNGVMVVSVYKFREREGGSMAVSEPASTSFDIRLYDAQNHHTLWVANFSETQEPLLSNLFSFNKAHSRGFRWITVEELMAQGLQERLSDCPYLQ
ncbi:MAG: hypothetical protein ACK5PS_11315 [Desulfopila sp.]